MSQFLSLASERDLRLHEDIQSRACAGCGTIFVPGVNSSVKVVPVPETKQEKQKRKATARKKAKAEKRKTLAQGEEILESKLDLNSATSKALGIKAVVDADAPATIETTYNININTNINSTTTNTTAIISSDSIKNPLTQKRPLTAKRKTIRIIPYTAEPGKIFPTTGKNKVDRKSKQLQNHIVYHCQRCGRETEIPGTKKAYVESRIKPPKVVTQRRKLKKATVAVAAADVAIVGITQASQQLSASSRTASPSLLHSTKLSPSPSTTTTRSTVAGQKRTRPSEGCSASAPLSPVGGLSRAPSTTSSSAATSPVSSPRIPTLDDKRNSVNKTSSNKKKKKTGLANMLANQKNQKDTPPDPSNGESDSVLANFLKGL
ncbi:hypothetical protein BG004_006359 [Podila humilis]|nr:hypothetical protein BG004_006359 [Podila humilis]